MFEKYAIKKTKNLLLKLSSDMMKRPFERPEPSNLELTMDPERRLDFFWISKINRNYSYTEILLTKEFIQTMFITEILMDHLQHYKTRSYRKRRY